MADTGEFVRCGHELVRLKPTSQLRFVSRSGGHPDAHWPAFEIKDVLQQMWVAFAKTEDGTVHEECRWRDVPVIRQQEEIEPTSVNTDVSAVQAVCDRVGYGRTMQLASELWSKTGITEQNRVLMIGPSRSLTVDCIHPENGRDEQGTCTWCCGTGWVTKKVAAVMQCLELADA